MKLSLGKVLNMKKLEKLIGKGKPKGKTEVKKVNKDVQKPSKKKKADIHPANIRKRKPNKKSTAAKKSKRGLLPKQQFFVREYLVDMNATQAYLRAGYKVSESVAAVNALNLLRKPKIAKAVNDVLNRRIKKLDISNDTVLQEIAKMAFGNMLDYIKIQTDGTAHVDLSKLTREQAAAIQELSFEEGIEIGENGVKPVKKVKFKLSDKKGSLELLAKYLKLFNETTPVITPEMKTIMNEVVAGTLPVKDAAYKINLLGKPLPEAVKIDFSKQEPVPAEDTRGAISNEEIMRRYEEQMADVQTQSNSVVPERVEEIARIKKDLESRDMFVDSKGEDIGQPNS